MSVQNKMRKLTLAGLATLGALACGLVTAGAPALAASAPVFGQPLPAGAITRTTATVSAALNPGESATNYEVLYGTTSAYGQHTLEVKAGEGSSEEAVTAGLTGLVPGTTYHYEFVATNAEGSTTGSEETFTTNPPTPPAAVTDGASNIALTSATVTGTIDSEGLPTSYELDLGTDASYGTSIYGEAGSGTQEVGISVALQNLAPGSTYHYRIDAINSDGRAYGADQTFTTPAYDKPIMLPATLPLLATPSIVFPVETKNSANPAVKKKAKQKKRTKRTKKAKPKKR